MRVFLDSNILVYANDSRDLKKQQVAVNLVGSCMRESMGVISVQVLQEYANVALGKLKQSSDIVLRQLHLLEALEVVMPKPQMVRRSVEIREAYGISFWDSAIVAAAEYARCDAILSEDLNTGQYYAGIIVRNPFAALQDGNK